MNSSIYFVAPISAFIKSCQNYYETPPKDLKEKINMFYKPPLVEFFGSLVNISKMNNEEALKTYRYILLNKQSSLEIISHNGWNYLGIKIMEICNSEHVDILAICPQIIYENGLNSFLYHTRNYERIKPTLLLVEKIA